ncbi:MAG: tetratricopeptide repeat protein [Granulicella sp.]
MTLDRALHENPLEPNILLQYGLMDAQSGKREEALVRLQKAIEINPDLSEGYFNLANRFVQTGRADEAEPLLARALVIELLRCNCI